MSVSLQGIRQAILTCKGDLLDKYFVQPLNTAIDNDVAQTPHGIWGGVTSGSTDITGGNATRDFNVNMDGAGASNITISKTGLNTAAKIATAMQAGIRAIGTGGYTLAEVWYDDDSDRYFVMSGTAGATSSVALTAGTSQDLLTSLKLLAADGARAAAGSASMNRGIAKAMSYLFRKILSDHPATACTDSAVADHPATACTGADVADHPATACTDSAVADHPATVCTGSAVADHVATACTDSAVADHVATACTDSAVADHVATACTDSAVADHVATACTDSAVADHVATACTDSAVADHGAITPAGSTDAGSATISASSIVPDVFRWLAPAAAGVNVVAQMAGDVDESTWGNITQESTDSCRTIQVVASATWDGGNIKVTAAWSDGTYEEKTLTATAGATVESAYGVIPGTIVRVRNASAWSMGTCDVEYGPKLAVQTGGKTPTLLAAYDETNGKDAGATISVNGVISGLSAPNAALNFRAVVSLAVVVADTGHTHTVAAITVTPPAHVVTQPNTPAFVHGVTQPNTPAFVHGVTQPNTPAFVHGVTQPNTPAFVHGVTQPNTPAFVHGVTQPDTPVLAHAVTQPNTPVLAHAVTQPDTPVLAHVVTQPNTPILAHTES